MNKAKNIKVKPKPKPPPPAPPRLHRLLPVVPELLSAGYKRAVSPWVWMSTLDTLPRSVVVEWVPFGSPNHRPPVGTSGHKADMFSCCANLRDFGTVVLSGAKLPDGTYEVTSATALPLAGIVADIYVGIYGDPLSGDGFHPRHTPRRLLHRLEWAMLGVAAALCRSGEDDGCASSALAETYGESWEWDGDAPLGPRDTPVRLTDPSSYTS